MGVSQSIFKVIRFPRLQSLPLFFSLVPIHSVSHTYFDALCSIISNFCLHFTRPGPYSISLLVLAGKQKGYDYPTFLTCYKLQERKSCQKFIRMCYNLSFNVSHCHDGTHNHPLPCHTICLHAFRPRARGRGRGVK